MVVDDTNPAEARSLPPLVLADFDNTIKRLTLDLMDAERCLAFSHLSESTLHDLSRALARLQAEVDALTKPIHTPIAPAPNPFKVHLQALGRSLALFSLTVLRVVAAVGLWAMIFGFLILFGLQFSHPAKWDTWQWVVLLHQLGDPVLALLDSLLDWPAAVPYYPFTLAALSSMAKIVVDANLRRFCRSLQKSWAVRAALAIS